MKCAERYIIGAHIFFLVCRLDEGHDGMHWDEAVELDWLAHEPSEQEFLSHYAADVTVPPPSERES